LDVYRAPLGGLALQDDRVARERLLLRIAAGSARGRLIVSYPRMDTGMARPRVPSFYALEVMRAAEGQLLDLRAFEKRASGAAPTRLGFPAPADARQAIDDAEYDLATLWDLQRRPKAEAPGRGRYMVMANEHLGRSLRARYRRWRGPWCCSDGLVENAAPALQILESHRCSQRAYSPTALQRFAACPYQFFLSAIARLEPREQKAAIEKLDPLTRGALFHELQFAFFNELKSAGRLPLRPDGLSEALDAADRILNETEKRYAEELAPAIPGVWRAEIEDIRTDLRGWVRHLAEASPEWVPLHFEYAFGLKGDRARDRESREEEAVILDGVRLRGSIDLIEKHVSRDVLRVTDHKTGRPPNPFPAHIGGGRFLQPMLYSLAVEKLLGIPVETARLSYCTERGGYTDLHMPVKDIGRHAIQLAMQTVDYHIGDGFLPAAPAEEACSLCDFHAACGPYEEMRVHKKSQKELDPLNLLRGMP
jgi:RecB family exonuclease